MYGDSHALSSYSRPIFPSNSKPKEEPKNSREQQLLFMESDANTNYRQLQFSGSQNNSGLLRYRSAPTSLLAIFANGTEKSENLTSGFCSDEENSTMHVLENDENSGNKSGFSRFAAMNSQLPPQYPRQNGSLSVDDASFRGVGSMGIDHQGQGKMGSNLIRQNSSPAGLFSHLTSQNGYAGVRGIGSYRMVDGGTNGDISPRLDFSPGMPSSLGMLSQIREVENENGGAIGLDDPKVGNSSGDNLYFSSGFPFGSWNDSSHFAENFSSGIKRELDNDHKLFVNAQNGELGNRPQILSHHLSLPKTSVDQMASMEKLLQFQDTVPCKIRAKRGCATHPRSIAERIRRTRISERMRKLQELVPNMDKQTNTADMLDLAVEYIKNLQKQYKILSDNRVNCKCSAFQKVV